VTLTSEYRSADMGEDAVHDRVGVDKRLDVGLVLIL